MAKHEKITVMLAATKAGRVPVAGFATASPHFAVTPRYDANPRCDVSRDFCVTHIETGMSVANYLGKRSAFKIAAALGGLIDWSGTDIQAIAKRFTTLPQSWQRWARQWPV